MVGSPRNVGKGPITDIAPSEAAGGLACSIFTEVARHSDELIHN
jgi:hypothetical protein